MEAVVAVVGLLGFVVFATLSLALVLSVANFALGNAYAGSSVTLTVSGSLVLLGFAALFFGPPQADLLPPRLVHCWDTDATGLCTVLKDINRDGFCNDRDCPFSFCDCR